MRFCRFLGIGHCGNGVRGGPAGSRNPIRPITSVCYIEWAERFLGDSIAGCHPSFDLTMPQCKSCRTELDHPEAAASIFDLSFLRLDKIRNSRKVAMTRAREVGPLCPKCLSRWLDHGGRPPKKKKAKSR